MNKKQTAITAALTGEHFCKDCKHRRLTWKWPLGLLTRGSIYYWATCAHPDLITTTVTKGGEYQVDGSIVTRRIVHFCSILREEGRACGPSGKFWETK